MQNLDNLSKLFYYLTTRKTMPSSRPHSIPIVISFLRQINPTSILDVGVGFGKWGFLFREYTDIVRSELDPPRYKKENWKIKIDGIEGFPDYITPAHHYIYNNIYLGDVREVLPKLGKYDLIFMGDIIEHLPKEEGKELIREALKHTNRYLILTTPRFDTKQSNVCGNELERHRSLWSAKDFKAIANAEVLFLPGDILLAIYPKPGYPHITFPYRNRMTKALRQFLSRIGRKILGDELYQLVRNRLPF